MTQDQVAAALGSPNIVTRDAAGRETWIYDKIASEASYSSSDAYGTILAPRRRQRGRCDGVDAAHADGDHQVRRRQQVETFSYHASKF